MTNSRAKTHTHPHIRKEREMCAHNRICSLKLNERWKLYDGNNALDKDGVRFYESEKHKMDRENMKGWRDRERKHEHH